MSIGTTEIEFEDKTYVLTEVQGRVVLKLIEAKEFDRVRALLAQCALDLPEGSQVPPGGASNPPIRDQAPKPGDVLQPEESPPNVSSSVVDSRPRTPKAGTPEAAAAAAEAASEDAGEAGGGDTEAVGGEGSKEAEETPKTPAPGETDPEKDAKLKKLENLQVKD